MAEKTNLIFVCSNCDAQSPKWSGRCLECGAWGTLEKQVAPEETRSFVDKAKKLMTVNSNDQIINLASLPKDSQARFLTGNNEIDRVLGGGLVAGSLVLLGGEPGIGKSTLVAQIAEAIAKNINEPILYVSGEESAAQVKSRLERLNCNLDKLLFMSETNIDKIMAAALKTKPPLLIIDSIQTVYAPSVPSEAGSLNQIRAGAVRFLELAKGYNIAVLLIGHITKDGQIAGPKSLEHIVDTVMYLESENLNGYSLLRAAKNRFGSVNEIGVLEMTVSGFKEVKDPSSAFLENQAEKVAGSVIGCVIEGTRAFLVDVQSLVTKTVFGYPQRKASGFDLNRLQVLIAVLSKRQKLNLGVNDIILNLVGGLKINDPALDLAVCLALVSAFLNQEVDRRLVVLGEVGLGGEVRPVSKIEARLSEAAKLGFKKALIPEMKIEGLAKFKDLQLIKVKNIAEAIKAISN